VYDFEGAVATARRLPDALWVSAGAASAGLQLQPARALLLPAACLRAAAARLCSWLAGCGSPAVRARAVVRCRR
jgi:hypothetical protein